MAAALVGDDSRVSFTVRSTICRNLNVASGTAGIAIIGAVHDTDIVVDGATVEVHGRVFPSAAFVALPDSRFHGRSSVRIANSTFDMSQAGGEQASGVTFLRARLDGVATVGTVAAFAGVDRAPPGVDARFSPARLAADAWATPRGDESAVGEQTRASASGSSNTGDRRCDRSSCGE